MTWFKKEKSRAGFERRDKTVHTEGLFIKCEGCHTIILEKGPGGEREGLPEVQSPCQD